MKKIRLFFLFSVIVLLLSFTGIEGSPLQAAESGTSRLETVILDALSLEDPVNPIQLLFFKAIGLFSHEELPVEYYWSSHIENDFVALDVSLLHFTMNLSYLERGVVWRLEPNFEERIVFSIRDSSRMENTIYQRRCCIGSNQTFRG